MIAVVDPAAERGIEIGAAASAGLAARLVQDDGATRFGETQSCREPREPRAHHMDAAHSTP